MTDEQQVSTDTTNTAETSLPTAPVIEQWKHDKEMGSNKSISLAPDMLKYSDQIAELSKIPVQKTPELIAQENQTKVEEAKVTETTKPTETANFEARKLYLEAQRQQREATQKLKEATETAAKYQAMEEAKAKGDYVAWVKAGGYDINEFYQNLTKQGMEMEQKVDPVAEAKKASEQAVKTVQDLQAAMQTQQEQIAISNKIATDVLPLLSKEPDKYETILHMHNGDANKAAIYIFSSAVQAFEQSGKAIPLNIVAERLEQYHQNLIEDGLINVSKMKKFQSKFGKTENNNVQSQQSPKQTSTMTKTVSTNDAKDIPVITNKQSARSAYSESITSGQDIIDTILKKHGYSR